MERKEHTIQLSVSASASVVSPSCLTSPDDETIAKYRDDIIAKVKSEIAVHINDAIESFGNDLTATFAKLLGWSLPNLVGS